MFACRFILIHVSTSYMEPALRRSYRKTSQRFWSMETLWRCCRTSWLTALTTQMLVTCMSFICIDITTIYCLLYILHLFWSHHHIMDKQCLCLSVCLSVIPSGAFCAAWLQSPTPAFDSTELGHMAPTFSTPPPWCSLREWVLQQSRP